MTGLDDAREDGCDAAIDEALAPLVTAVDALSDRVDAETVGDVRAALRRIARPAGAAHEDGAARQNLIDAAAAELLPAAQIERS